jgi:hypothetical protein
LALRLAAGNALQPAQPPYSHAAWGISRPAQTENGTSAHANPIELGMEFRSLRGRYSLQISMKARSLSSMRKPTSRLPGWKPANIPKELRQARTANSFMSRIGSTISSQKSMQFQ